MKAVLLLGLRLSGLGARPAVNRSTWWRSAMVATAALVGVVLLLGIAAVLRAELRLHDTTYLNRGLLLLLFSVSVTIALPVLMLAATAGRLSAALRDQRLANLRLLGLSPVRTRVVAAVETGVAALVGGAAGVLAFVLTRPLLVHVRPGGREWTSATLQPAWSDYLLAVLSVPLAVVAVAALPQRLGARGSLAVAARADKHRPRWWRLVPLIAGVAVSSYVLLSAEKGRDNARLAPFMLAGLVLLGIGTVAVIPIFVRLIADLLVRFRGTPTLLIAGRRLQAQPAAMTRVVAVLLVGLFVVAGARALVVAFEQTPQYQSETRMMTTGQRVSLDAATTARAAEIRAALAGEEGIRAVLALPTLVLACPQGRGCPTAVVATCEQLAAVTGAAHDCREEPRWLTPPTPATPAGGSPPVLRWHDVHDERPGTRAVEVPVPRVRVAGGETLIEPVRADVILPPDTPGLGAVLADTHIQVLVVAERGHDLVGILTGNAGIGGFQAPSTGYYDFVSGLRSIVWAVAAAILSIGLLAFGIGAVDRSVARRRELAGLQLLGVPLAVLRRSHWVEAALPLTIGTVLATGLGLLAGATYLSYGGILPLTPWRQTMTLAVIALGCAAGVSAMTVGASSPRLRAENIRTD